MRYLLSLTLIAISTAASAQVVSPTRAGKLCWAPTDSRGFGYWESCALEPNILPQIEARGAITPKGHTSTPGVIIPVDYPPVPVDHVPVPVEKTPVPIPVNHVPVLVSTERSQVAVRGDRTAVRSVTARGITEVERASAQRELPDFSGASGGAGGGGGAGGR